MGCRARSIFGGVVASLAFASSAHAQAEQAAVLWYRASEQCPTGPDFLARLGEKSSRARLAAPADHFDFLVTLVAANGETVGRLERQTQSGTVAIRELRDPSCDRVADALALGLSLSLEPSSAPAPQAKPPAAAASEPSETLSAHAAIEPQTPPKDQGAERRPSRQSAKEARNLWSVGVNASALEGTMPKPLWQGFAFVDFARAPNGARPKFSLRAGVVGAFGSVATQVGDVKHTIVAGRVEACPWRAGTDKVGLWPCAAFELGALSASDSRPSRLDAHEVWAAPGALLRLAYAVLPPFSLEAQAGGLVPLVRETVYAGSAPLYTAEIIAFQASIGVSARLW